MNKTESILVSDSYIRIWVWIQFSGFVGLYEPMHFFKLLKFILFHKGHALACTLSMQLSTDKQGFTSKLSLKNVNVSVKGFSVVNERKKLVISPHNHTTQVIEKVKRV